VPAQRTASDDEDLADVRGLMAAAAAGDRSAFARLWVIYRPVVTRFVYVRTHHKMLAEDVASETFLRALARIGSWQWTGRDPGAWLLTIARNLIADHYKSGRYRLEVSTDDLNHDQCEGPEGRPDVAVIDHITNVALLTAVMRLTAEQRQCIELRFLHGLSVAETAQVMGKNDGAVKAVQYRAVRTLARMADVAALR